MPVLQVNSCSIDQKNGEICTGKADLQPISFKSDRLLVVPSEITKIFHRVAYRLTLARRAIGILETTLLFIFAFFVSFVVQLPF